MARVGYGFQGAMSQTARPDVIFRSPDPLPPQLRCSMTNCNSGTISADPAVPFVYGTEGGVFQLNSLFEPQIGGTQPYGYDQFTPFYENFKVESVDIKITAGNHSGATIVYGMQFLAPGIASNMGGVAIDTVNERPFVQYLVVPNFQTRDYQVSFGIHQVLQVPKATFDADVSQYTHKAATNPALMPTMHHAVASASITGAATLYIEMTYHCLLWSRVILPTS